MSSIADVAVPWNRVLPEIQPQSARSGDRPAVAEAKSAMKITPETYSGVAVVAMAKVDSTRSVRLPSRMPRQHAQQQRGRHHHDHHPEHQPAGMAQAAAQHLGHRLLEDGGPAPVALQDAAKARRGLGGQSFGDAAAALDAVDLALPAGQGAQPLPVADKDRTVMPVLVQPGLHRIIRHPHRSLGFRKLFQVGGQVRQVEDDEGQRQRGQHHDPDAAQDEHEHVVSFPLARAAADREDRLGRGDLGRQGKEGAGPPSGLSGQADQAAIHHL
jgi:hypothetical protein